MTVYERAGVREYWIVYPEPQATTVYRFEAGGPVSSVHPFADPVAVGIWEDVFLTLADLV